jgi:hypothetical protein
VADRIGPAKIRVLVENERGDLVRTVHFGATIVVERPRFAA